MANKHFFLVFALIFSLNTFSARKTSNLKSLGIAFVDIDLIFEKIPTYLGDIKELETETRIWQNKIAKKKIEINQLKEKLQAERLILPAETILEKEKEIEYLVKELAKYENKKFGTNGEFITKKEFIMKPHLEEVRKVLVKIAKEKRIKIIFEKSPSEGSNILYGNPRYDITKLVLDRLRKREKVKTIKKVVK